jgi:3-oxocholest-4-en-26-oyl-CoA dehydrogenase beta subunit
MEFALTEEQEILCKFAHDFLTQKYDSKTLRSIEKGSGFSSEIWKEMVDLGWLGLPFPQKYNGAGMTFFDMAVLLEEMGSCCAVSPYFSSVILAGMPVYLFGNENQKQSIIRNIAEGIIYTSAIYEESSVLSPKSIKASAQNKNGRWYINGTKLFVPDAHIADYILCLIKTDNQPDESKNYTIFIVNAHDKNIKSRLMQTRVDKLSEILFTDVVAENDDIIGGKGKGWEIALKLITIATIFKCCEMLGTAEKALDITISYAKERKQYGKPIAGFQAIQHYAAEMKTDLVGMKICTYKAAWMLNENLQCDREIAIAKLWSMKTCENIINQTHQIHGAIGVTEDYDLHFYTKRLKMFQLTYLDRNSCNSIITGTK